MRFMAMSSSAKCTERALALLERGAIPALRRPLLGAGRYLRTSFGRSYRLTVSCRSRRTSSRLRATVKIAGRPSAACRQMAEGKTSVSQLRPLPQATSCVTALGGSGTWTLEKLIAASGISTSLVLEFGSPKIYGIDGIDRYLSVVHFAFIAGSRRCIMMLHLGATVVINHATYVVNFFDQIAEKKINWTFLTPSHLKPLWISPQATSPLYRP